MRLQLAITYSRLVSNATSVVLAGSVVGSTPRLTMNSTAPSSPPNYPSSKTAVSARQTSTHGESPLGAIISFGLSSLSGTCRVLEHRREPIGEPGILRPVTASPARRPGRAARWPVAEADVVITAGRDIAGRDPDPDATLTRPARDSP
jgi:hypothetical protein